MKQRDVIAARGAVHFDKQLLGQLLQPDAGEAIATRYDPNDDTYYVATTSGKTYKFPRAVIDKARARESSDVPTLFDADGTEIPSDEMSTKSSRSFIEQQIREFEKKYEQHAKQREEQRRMYDGKPKGGKPESKPKTFDEAWEMAEARLWEAINDNGGVPYCCVNSLGVSCPHLAVAEVQITETLAGNPVRLCAVCAYETMEKLGVGILDSADE